MTLQQSSATLPLEETMARPLPLMVGRLSRDPCGVPAFLAQLFALCSSTPLDNYVFALLQNTLRR